MLNPRDFESKRTATGWTVFYRGRNTGFRVLADSKFTGMWRVKYPDGELSDMVNASRATDAAVFLASSTENKPVEAGAERGATLVIPVHPLSRSSQDSARRKIA